MEEGLGYVAHLSVRQLEKILTDIGLERTEFVGGRAGNAVVRMFSCTSWVELYTSPRGQKLLHPFYECGLIKPKTVRDNAIKEKVMSTPKGARNRVMQIIAVREGLSEGNLKKIVYG